VIFDVGTNPHTMDQGGKTGLHFAGWSGSAKDIQALLKAGADVHAKDLKGRTALHCAGGSGSTEAVEALLAAGARVHAKDNHRRTPLHYAGVSGSAGAVKALLAAGAKVHTADYSGRTALHCAGESGSAMAIEALLAAGADVHTEDNSERTALHMVSRSGAAEAVAALVAAGADVSGTDEDAWTALHFAASYGNTGAVAALLGHGAEPSPVCHTGETPLCLAVALGHREIIGLLPTEHPSDAISTPAHEAVRNERLELLNAPQVHFFLNEADKDCGDSVLHIAARRAHLPSVEALLHLNVWVRPHNVDGHTPLACALEWLDPFLCAQRDVVALPPGTRSNNSREAVAVGRRDILGRDVAVGRPVRRAAVDDSVRDKLDEWRGVVLALLREGADTEGLSRDAAQLCARVVASEPSLGPWQAVRLLRGKRVKRKAT